MELPNPNFYITANLGQPLEYQVESSAPASQHQAFSTKTGTFLVGIAVSNTKIKTVSTGLSQVYFSWVIVVKSKEKYAQQTAWFSPQWNTVDAGGFVHYICTSQGANRLL